MATQSEYVGKNYGEIYQIWSRKFGVNANKAIHIKWKQIAAQVR